MMKTLFPVVLVSCLASVALAAPIQLPGLPLADGAVTIGDPLRVDNLTLFPIYGQQTADLAGIISLEAAIAAGQAKVREIGSTPSQGPRPANPAAPPQEQRIHAAPNRDAAQIQQRVSSPDVANLDGGGASVGTLVIENASEARILVLAGTVVKGGRQDRQIGQDFVIGPRQSVPVDAFCVERGRWSGKRDGVTTGGEFQATEMLAPQQVRAAGQYENDQGKVWDKVQKVNDDNAKGTSSGTLMATYDDEAIVAKREKIAARVDGLFAALPHESATVGLAYAVSGKVRAARWFAAHQLFGEHRRKLVLTAAVEALTAAARGEGDGKALTAAQVQGFIAELRRAAVERTTETKSMNTNRYRKSKRGYSSEAVIEENGVDVPVTTDFLFQ